jgi:hypothetical protein
MTVAARAMAEGKTFGQRTNAAMPEANMGVDLIVGVRGIDR